MAGLIAIKESIVFKIVSDCSGCGLSYLTTYGGIWPPVVRPGQLWPELWQHAAGSVTNDHNKGYGNFFFLDLMGSAQIRWALERLHLYTVTFYTDRLNV